MSIKYPEFIGRTDQLGEIQASIAQTERPVVVINIAGAGGVGKTSTLQEIKRLYSSAAGHPDFLVTDLIDFSRTAHRVQSWVLGEISQNQPADFKKYKEKVDEVEHTEPAARWRMEEEALNQFIQDYNLLAARRRIILLFDTIELIQETPLMEALLELAAKMHNTVLVLAGRENDHPLFVERLHAAFGSPNVLPIQLKGFNADEAQLYFQHTIFDSKIEVNENLQKNIFLLTQGTPIKIALSLDWLDRGIPLMPEITTFSPDALAHLPPKELNKLQKRFEHALMEGIRKLDESTEPDLPVFEVILYMAHLNKRFNRSILEFFFFSQLAPEAARERSDRLIARLKELPFVKYLHDDYFVLHDEMVRLVQEYVWDCDEDPDKSLRRSLSKKASEYYDPKIDDLVRMSNRTEQDNVTMWAYRVEQMYYKLYANFEDGYLYFEKLFENLVDDHRPSLAALTIKFIREFKQSDEFTGLLLCFLDNYYDAGVLINQQRFNEAQQKLVDGIDKVAQLSQVRSARPSRLDQHLYRQVYKLNHKLGYCYRSTGNWDKAIEYYDRSRTLALERAGQLDDRLPEANNEKQLLMEQIAETLNSLSNVHRLQGNLQEARSLCKTSILLRKKKGGEQLARSHYVMGMVLWEMGGTAEAMRYLEDAYNYCTPKDQPPPADQLTPAMLTKYRGYILYRTGRPEQALHLLQEAEAVFRRMGQLSELVDVMNMRSRIYREHPDIARQYAPGQKSMVTTIQVTQDALEIARRVGDQYRISECYLTLAFHFYRYAAEDPEHARQHELEALKYYQLGYELSKESYYQLSSQYCGLRGDIAFNHHDYKEAFEQYAEQCKLATKFKQATYERSIDHLGDRLRSLGELDALEFADHASWLEAFWKQECPDRPELINEITQIRGEIAERERLRQLQLNYRQYYLNAQAKKAMQCCDKILRLSGLYNDPYRAQVILDKVQAAHRCDELWTARQLAKVAIEVGKTLDNQSILGSAYLILAEVLWDTTSTAEAAENLIAAEAVFKASNDEVGLARAKRLRSYIRFRTGLVEENIGELGEALQVFERHHLDGDIAKTLNIMSRMARTNPSKRSNEKSREYAQKALQQATIANDHYLMCECYISLANIAHHEKSYDKTLQYCQAGLRLISPETHLLVSTLHSYQGMAYYELGLQEKEPEKRAQYLDQAFKAFYQELQAALKSKPARLIRTLDSLQEVLAQLPEEETSKYAQQIQKDWNRLENQPENRMLLSIYQQAMLYRPFFGS